MVLVKDRAKIAQALRDDCEGANAWRGRGMIDLHSHILPGIDDGAANLAVSLAMAEAFVADGVQIVAATPHIMPGVWPNDGPAIRQLVHGLQYELDRHGIGLQLVIGADVHVAPNLAGQLASGAALSLADSRYVLVEPPHHVPPPRLEDMFFELLLAGYVPILTHPERLSWIKGHYAMIGRLVQAGVWMQVTSGSLRGAFGSGPKQWAERLLDDGFVHILASDAHDVARRRPDLSVGWELAARRVGDEEAWYLVVGRPQAILDNGLPSAIPMPPRSGVTVGSVEGAAARGNVSGDRHDKTEPMGVSGGVGRVARRLRQLLG
jgi:protein-tyrosine phosphatase